MKTCDFCGNEGCAPNVRGATSISVNIGNYRNSADIRLTICEMCAKEILHDALEDLMHYILLKRF